MTDDKLKEAAHKYSSEKYFKNEKLIAQTSFMDGAMWESERNKEYLEIERENTRIKAKLDKLIKFLQWIEYGKDIGAKNQHIDGEIVRNVARELLQEVEK